MFSLPLLSLSLLPLLLFSYLSLLSLLLLLIHCSRLRTDSFRILYWFRHILLLLVPSIYHSKVPKHQITNQNLLV